MGEPVEGAIDAVSIFRIHAPCMEFSGLKFSCDGKPIFVVENVPEEHFTTALVISLVAIGVLCLLLAVLFFRQVIILATVPDLTG